MTASVPALDLASLLCSRLCHDMLSPVGALSNGLELLASEPGLTETELDAVVDQPAEEKKKEAPAVEAMAKVTARAARTGSSTPSWRCISSRSSCSRPRDP